MTKFLVSCNVNINALDSKDRSALFIAIESKNWSVAEFLIEKGAKVFASNDRLARMLCQAGLENDVKTVQMLNKVNVDLEISDYDKRSVGHLAAAEGHFELMSYLKTETKFNFEIKDRWGTRAIDECRNAEQRTQLEAL